MEENPKPRSRAFLVACLLISLIPGAVGALFGAVSAIPQGPRGIRDNEFLLGVIGGPLVGLAVGYTVHMLKPRRETWEGCLGWAVLLVADALGSALLAALVFYLTVRIQRG